MIFAECTNWCVCNFILRAHEKQSFPFFVGYLDDFVLVGERTTLQSNTCLNYHIQHPVIDDRLAHMRQRDCPPGEFRRRVGEISLLMVPSVTANLLTLPIEVETPMEITTGRKLQRDIVLAPILRAGLGMLDSFLDVLSEASVAHVGLARNEDTLQPECYYHKSPEHIADADVIVLDPKLATGGSASAAITALKNQGAKHLSFVCLVAAPEGLSRINTDHPDVTVYYPALDNRLNEKGYILPGLGDAGDRIFGTL